MLDYIVLEVMKEVCGNSHSYFHVLESENEDLSADKIIEKILIETITGESIRRIAKEVKKLQIQFWR